MQITTLHTYNAAMVFIVGLLLQSTFSYFDNFIRITQFDLLSEKLSNCVDMFERNNSFLNLHARIC